jgi:hypothetical protein
MLFEWIERLARHRMPADERLRQEAFRREIDASWTPARSADRRVERRSRLVHLGTSLTAGGVTLAAVGVSGVVTAFGSLLITLSPASHTATYDSEIPMWVSVVLTLGIVGIAAECARSPHAIQPRRFIVVACLPLAVGSLSAAATMDLHLAPDVILMLAFALNGAGLIYAGWGASSGRSATMRRGLAIVGISALGVFLSDGSWTLIYGLDGDPLKSVGCLFSAGGALLMAQGFIYARPNLEHAAR